MPVPPAVECPANQTLITEIMELTEDAVRNHYVMAGSADTPESFIRDWVAIDLYRRYQERGLTVVLETLKSDFRKYVVEKYVEKSSWATFDKIKQFKLDAIVWVGPMPRMILEFKRHAKEEFECDAKRTAQILSVLPGLNIEGYLVSFIVDKSKPRYETYRTAIKSVS